MFFTLDGKMNKQLTQQEAKAIRLAHHSFEHWPKKCAADIMSISVSRLNQILRSAKKKAPGLFPILNYNQAYVSQELDAGCSHIEIANRLGLTIKQVDGVVAQLHRLGVAVYHRPRTVSYNPSMDGQVKERF